MLPLQQWTQDILLIVLQALQTLILLYGPIKLSPKMVCVNEIGEVKLWVSENAVNNHPDAKYAKEEQTLADLAAIVTNKNQDLASKILGCHIFKDLIEKLTQPSTDQISPNNYSHRVSEGEEYKFKKYEGRTKGGPYRNVFGDLAVQSQPKVATNFTPHKTKKDEATNQPRREEQSKPTSNISQYRDFHFIGSAKKALKDERPTDRAITNARLLTDNCMDFKLEKNLQKSENKPL